MIKKEKMKQSIQWMSARLKASRQLRGYRSRTAFALRCEIPLATYRTHETGEVEMRSSDVIRYAKILNISMAWLLTGEGDAFEHYKIQPTAIEKDNLSDYLQIAVFKIQREQKNNLRYMSMVLQDVNSHILK